MRILISHRHHRGDDGISCRYCHTSVEVSENAGLPPMQTCMNCHSQIWADSPYLEPVRASWRTGRAVEWRKVHDLPDYVYFNHTAHVMEQNTGGRPKKIEGNPLHPASLSHTDIFAQASLLELYDPDRSKIVLEDGTPATWGHLQGALQNVLQQKRAQGGAGLRILTGAVHSPTLARQLRTLRAELPQVR